MKKIILISVLTIYVLMLGIIAFAESPQIIDDYVGKYYDVNNSETTLQIEYDETIHDAVKIKMDVFRLGEIELTAVFETERIVGTAYIDEESSVIMEIIKTEEGLTLTILESNWMLMQAGREFCFTPISVDI